MYFSCVDSCHLKRVYPTKTDSAIKTTPLSCSDVLVHASKTVKEKGGRFASTDETNLKTQKGKEKRETLQKGGEKLKKKKKGK